MLLLSSRIQFFLWELCTRPVRLLYNVWVYVLIVVSVFRVVVVEKVSLQPSFDVGFQQ